MDLYQKQNQSFFIGDGYDLQAGDIPSVSHQENKQTSVLEQILLSHATFCLCIVSIYYFFMFPSYFNYAQKKQEVLTIQDLKVKHHFPRVYLCIFLVSEGMRAAIGNKLKQISVFWQHPSLHDNFQPFIAHLYGLGDSISKLNNKYIQIYRDRDM